MLVYARQEDSSGYSNLWEFCKIKLVAMDVGGVVTVVWLLLILKCHRQHMIHLIATKGSSIFQTFSWYSSQSLEYYEC